MIELSNPAQSHSIHERTMPEPVSIFDCCTPEEAAEMGAFLEKRGIRAFTDRGIDARTNNWGAANYVSLKVRRCDTRKAIAHLRRKFPERFGNPEKVAALERDILRQMSLILVTGLCLGVLAYYLLSRFSPEAEFHSQTSSTPYPGYYGRAGMWLSSGKSSSWGELNAVVSVVVGLFGGIGFVGIMNRLKRRKK